MSAGAMARMLNNHGETWTMNAWSGSTPDEYEDELPTGEVSSTFKGLRNQLSEGGPEQFRTASGRTLVSELRLFVLSSLSVPPSGQDGLPVTLTSPEGREYNLVGVGHDGAPLGTKQLYLMSGGSDANLYL